MNSITYAFFPKDVNPYLTFLKTNAFEYLSVAYTSENGTSDVTKIATENFIVCQSVKRYF
jgi:hypothetical protein